MKDLFQNYHKHKVLSNLGLLSLSAILAVSINSFVLSGNIGDTIKASVLEVGLQGTQDLDFTMQELDNFLIFQNNKDMKQVKEISFSLAYNPEVLKLLQKQESNIEIITDSSGFSQYTIYFDAPKDIPANTIIFTQNFDKLLQETVYLNIANVVFTDNMGKVYRLSTSSIVF